MRKLGAVPPPAAVSLVPPPNQEADDIAAVPPVPAVQECHETVSQSLDVNFLATSTGQAASAPAAKAPVVNDDPRPNEWSNDADAWKRWFDRHPEELRKFLTGQHDYGR